MVSTKQKLKALRKLFREFCLKRDRYRCVMCAFHSTPEKAEQELDVHHITDRSLMPNGGYAPENGISLCHPCHEKAETYHSSGHTKHVPGYHPNDLYAKIDSSHEKALAASEHL